LLDNTCVNGDSEQQVNSGKNSIFVYFLTLCLCPSTNQAQLLSLVVVLSPCGTSQTGFSDAVSQERSQQVRKYAPQGQGARPLAWNPIIKEAIGTKSH